MPENLRQRAGAFLATDPEETPTVSTADVKKLVHGEREMAELKDESAYL